jgi:hypothetical protein
VSDYSEDEDSEDSEAHRKLKKKQKQQRRKAKEKKRKKEKRKGKSKGRSHKARSQRGHSSSSEDEDSSSSSSSSSSSDSNSEATPKPKWWYAVAWGKKGHKGVHANKQKAQSKVTDGSRFRKFSSEEEGWEWIGFLDREALGKATRKDRPEAEPTVPKPTRPPLILNGKDKSTQDDEEIFGHSVDVDTKVLRQTFAPPGVSEQASQELAEGLVDAVSLPGKNHQSSEGDDTAANISASLAELTHITRQEKLAEVTRWDLKWSNASRNSIRSVKDAEEIQELLNDVSEVRDQTLQNLISYQRTILMKGAWEDNYIEAWSFGGYYSVLSRLSIDHYISLLQHLLKVANTMSWKMAQREIDYYSKTWARFRGNSSSRLVALCHIYMSLRDGAAAGWYNPKLERAKVSDIYQMMGTGGPNSACNRCGTTLHGTQPCPWSHLKAKDSLKAGRQALAGLAKMAGTVKDSPGSDPEKKV